MQEHKYPLETPPQELLDDIGKQLALAEPPRYESQLRRSGAKEFDDGRDGAEAGNDDGLIHELEEYMKEKMLEDEPKPKSKAKAKAKAKSKSAPKSKSKNKKPDETELGGDANDEPEASEGEPQPPPLKKARASIPNVEGQDVPYPADAYEPPLHITGNHIYSNTYKKQLAKGLSKVQAQEEGRMQSLIFKTHGVVSQAKVGSFRAKKNAVKAKED